MRFLPPLPQSLRCGKVPMRRRREALERLGSFSRRTGAARGGFCSAGSWAERRGFDQHSLYRAKGTAEASETTHLRNYGGYLTALPHGHGAGHLRDLARERDPEKRRCSKAKREVPSRVDHPLIRALSPLANASLWRN